MTTSSVVSEELGPRGRRRVRIATAIAIILLALFLWWAYRKLEENGQTELAGWRALTEWDTVKYLLTGLEGTVKAAVIASIGAIVIGFALALLRLSKSAVARVVGVAWIELFRALPLLFLIIGVFFIDIALASGRGGGTMLGPFGSVVVALVLYNSAVLAEVFRAGVNSLDSGQSEAAQAVGMSYWQMMFVVVLPQAVRRMIPAIVAQIATLTKDVSLAYPIGYLEFVRRGRRTEGFGATTNFQANVMILVVYFFLVWSIARFARFLEERQKKSLKVESGAGDAALTTELEVGL